MVIFHSYVKLPEGNCKSPDGHKTGVFFSSREDLAHLHASGIDDADEALANWWYGCGYGYHDNRMGFFQGKTIGKP